MAGSRGGRAFAGSGRVVACAWFWDASDFGCGPVCLAAFVRKRRVYCLCVQK